MNLLSPVLKAFQRYVRSRNPLGATFPGCKIYHLGGWSVQRVSDETTGPVFGVAVCLSPGTVHWPDRCCTCGTAKTCGSAPEHTVMFSRFRRSTLRGTSSLPPPPICAQHADAPAFLLSVYHVRDCLAVGYAFSASEEFLREFRVMNTIPPPPPWITFPHIDPRFGWNQGSVEGYYLQKLWNPYVSELSESDRAALRGLQSIASPCT